MVVRPPIETWSRMQLEENFHSAYQQLRTAQKKISEQEKKITVLNTRLRSSVMERKTKEDAYVDKEKYEELERENQLLALKLKTAKHQILTYTTPAARSVTASAMTGRSTYRPQPSTIRRPPQTASTAADKTTRTEQPSERTRTPPARISESSLKDKAAYIRLNRLVREKNSQVAELQYEIERLNGLVADLRAQLEQKTSTVRELEAEARSALEKSDDSQYVGRIELITKQLAVIQAENEVLKEANERLVKQSLSVEFDESAKEQIELRKQISVLEERIKDTEQRRLRAEQKLKTERQKLKKMQKAEKAHQKDHTKIEEVPDELEPPPKKESRESKRSKKGKNDDDILERLYRDVSAILESHDDRLEHGNVDGSGVSFENVTRWKKMYADLYDELEKVRNMLLIQHNINQKQTTEITLLQEEMEAVKVRYETKLKEMRDKVVEKQRKVLVLEEQIRSIAYGTQKPIPLRPVEAKNELSTDLSIMFTSISLTDEFVASVGVCPAYFLSLEFFDFELQTTPMLTKQTNALDFTTIYSVVVSNLFVHYIETNGITIELYSPQNTAYKLLAAGVVNLKPLLQKGAKSRLAGELKLISLESGGTVAILNYELNTTEQLGKAITSFQKAEAAQKVLPIEIPLDSRSFEELTVMVHRCTGLENLKRGELEVCVIYEFFSFSPYFTNYVTSSKTAEFNSKRDWSLPSDHLQSYLAETEITFFLFENRAGGGEDNEGVLSMLSLPLSPLRENKPIKGSFEMVKADGSDCGVYLDVTIMWKFALSQVTSKKAPPGAETQKAVTSPPTVERPTEPKKAMPSQISVDNIRSSSSSLENDYSPVSVFSPKIPSVAESVERDSAPKDQEEIETVSVRRGSARSATSTDSMAEEGAQREDGKQSPTTLDNSSYPADLPRLSATESDQELTKQVDETSIEYASVEDTKETEKEKAKDEIRSLLGNLPPIGKPRLTKPPSEFSSFSSFVNQSKQGSQPSSSSGESVKSDDTTVERQRSVAFTDPLHRSIPPSESSSASSPPPKPAVRLPPSGGRSAIRARKENHQEEDTSDSDESRTVSIFIDRIYIPEFSRLLHPNYDNVKVYVDWFFLDYPLEDSRTPVAIPLPRIPDSPGLFVYKKEFHLSRRRVALLDQWLELGNRLDFTLITEGEDSEELAVAQLELSRTATDETTTIQFLDINGEHYADLDLVISYSPQIFDCLRG
nr:ER to Golgi vesicle transport protein, putative [Haemonchus contortus]